MNTEHINNCNNFYISFDNIGGRFGNQLFRYITCKLFTVKIGHQYICREDFPKDNYIIVFKMIRNIR